MRPDDRTPDRSALAGRRPGPAQVVGVVLLGLSACVVPHLIWLLLDSQRLELVEPSGPWVVLDVVLMAGLAAIGGYLLSRPAPDDSADS